MAMDLFNLVAKITLDKSEFESGINSLDSALGGAMKVGAAAIGAATGAIAAFGASSVQTGMQFDTAMSQVAATMGKTMDEMENEVGTVDLAWGKFSGNLREYAQEMGANTAFSATQAAEALNYMALAGYDTQTSMEMLPTVLNLAAAGNMELSTASDMVTDAQTALGLSLDETAIMVDQMAKASSTTNTSVSQLGEAFLTIGGNAKILKGGTSELSSTLGVLADNGIKGSEAGTHLRNILLSLTPKSDDAAEAMEKLGMKAYDSEGNLRSLDEIFLELGEAMDGMSDEERTNLLSTIFNKTDLASVNALLSTTRDRWNEVRQSVNSGIRLDLTLTEEGIREMQNKFTSLYDSLEGDTEEFSKQAKKYLEESFDLSDTQADAAINAFVDKMDEGVESAEDLYNALASSGSAAQQMADTQLDNLNGDITLMKSAFEGVQIAVSDGLTPTLRTLVQGATDGLSKVTTKITEYLQREEVQAKLKKITDAVERLINIVLDHLDEIFDVAVMVITGIIDVAGFLIENIDKIGIALGVISGLWVGIKALGIILSIGKVIGIVTTLIGSIGGLSTIIALLTNPITLVVAAVAAAAVAIIANWGKIKEVWGAAVQFFQNVWSGIKNAFSTVKSWISDKFSSAYNAVRNVWDKAGSFFSSVGSKIKTAMGNAGSWISEKFSAARNSISNGWSNLGERFGKIRDAIGNVFRNLPEYFGTIGRNLMTGLYNGIVEKFNSVIDKIKSVGQSIVDAAAKVFKIGSPSKVFREFGGFLMEGMAIGIGDKVGMVEDAMKDMSDMVYANTPGMNVVAKAQGQAGNGQLFSVPRQTQNKQLTVILELDRMQLGRAVYNLNNEETQRVGVKLAGGFA